MNVPGGRWVEINVDALRHNFKLIQKVAGESFVCPVVKANGYGLGAVEMARIFTEEGALMLAVTTVNEGIELRQAGIATPVLVMAPFGEEEASLLVQYQLTGTVVRLSQLEALAEVPTGENIRIHLKVETGMGRFGILVADFEPIVAWLREHESRFQVEGIFSNLADASRIRYTEKQIERFNQFLDILEREGLKVTYRHLANSLATLERPVTHYDMVRVGTALYGQLPPKTRNRIPLQNPWKVMARVISTSRVGEASSVGYNLDYVARRNMRIGVIPVGWADGLDVVAVRGPKRVWGILWEALNRMGKHILRRDSRYVTIRGRRYFYIGRSAMGLSTLRIDERVQVGDTAQVFMRRVTTDARMPRVYLEGGQVVRITGPGVF